MSDFGLDENTVVRLLRQTTEGSTAVDADRVDRDPEDDVRLVCGALGVLVGSGDKSTTSPFTSTERSPESRGRLRVYSRALRRGWAIADRISEWISHTLHVPALALIGIAASGFVGAGLLILEGELLAAVGLLLISAFCEVIDSGVATRSAFSRRDVFIDYVTDRIGDIVLLGCLALAYGRAAPWVSALAVALMIVASLSSYARAQAEALRFVSHARFGRFERLACVLVGITSAAALEALGLDGTVALAALLGIAVILTTTTMIQRIWAVVHQSPYVEVTIPVWDDESFLPRLIDDLVSAGSGLAVVQGDGDYRIGSKPNHVIYIDRYKNGTARVRLVEDAG